MIPERKRKKKRKKPTPAATIVNQLRGCQESRHPYRCRTLARRHRPALWRHCPGRWRASLTAILALVSWRWGNPVSRDERVPEPPRPSGSRRRRRPRRRNGSMCVQVSAFNAAPLPASVAVPSKQGDGLAWPWQVCCALRTKIPYSGSGLSTMGHGRPGSGSVDALGEMSILYIQDPVGQ